ncbi:MAG TPA: hypothetical protein VN179_02420, partial [Solirubrobacterales bacterium]|nr:hypothetical protein [Solirubrobacterales bacterium]
MRRLTLALVLTLALLGLFAAPATAAFDLRDLDVTFEAEDGSPELRAGAHPFAMSTTVGVSTEETPEGAVPEGELRDLEIMQIPGLIGSQTAVPRCNDAEFAQIVKGRPACPDETAVGYSAAEVEFKVIPPDQAGNFFHMPVYNLDPPPGAAARLGLIVLNVPVTIDLTLSRSHPYKLRAELNEIPQAILFYRSKVTLWGYPASPAHDSLRGNCLGIVNEPTPEPVSLGDCPVPLGTPEEAFLTLPRSCGEPLQTLFSATSWLGELAVGTAVTHDESGPAEIKDCGGLPFDAEAEARPTSASAASPTGLDFGIEVEDEGLIDPDERAQADVSRVEVSLPEGMTINPAAANGLEACTPAQFKAEGPDWEPDVGCPQASKLGTVEAQSPLLDEALAGELYVAAQNDNPFDSLFALYLVIRSERYGIVVKQAGRVDPDPATGQLRSTFAELPQLPFSELRVRFREGPRAPLTTPVSCGTHTATTTLTPSSGGAAIVDGSSFQITSGPDGGSCPTSPLPFAPGLTGGATDTRAGAYSPFYMRLTRSDAEQEITRFEAVLPPGVLGKIAGVGRCSDAQIAAADAAAGRAELTAPSCPASSRIGSVQAGAGVGPFPTYVDGALYLAGPYAGAPLSVA